MDKIFNTTCNTTMPSTLQNQQEEAAIPPPAAARNVKKAKQQQAGGERMPRPQQEQALNCPRCHSTNTKFCYYNNYSVTQPRYLCKACRRYWTKGGTLRNVPVGGRCRKNKQQNPSAPSALASSSDSKKIMNSSTQQLLMMMPPPPPPTAANLSNVLPTTFMSATGVGGGFELPSSDHHPLPFAPLSLPSNPGTTPPASSFLDLLPFLPTPSSFGAMMLQHGPGMIAGAGGGLQQQWLPSSQHGNDDGGLFAAGGSPAAAAVQEPQQQQQEEEVGGGDGGTAADAAGNDDMGGGGASADIINIYWSSSRI